MVFGAVSWRSGGNWLAPAAAWAANGGMNTVVRLDTHRRRSAPVAGLLAREPLAARIEVAATVVISAPAGFGKTVLLRQHRDRLAASGSVVGWIDAALEPDPQAPRGATAVIVDNLQSAAAPHALSALLRGLPDEAQVVLAGRGRRNLEIARERADDALLRLGGHDLAFDLEEVDRLLAVVDPSSARDLAHRLLRATQGWPAAVSSAISVLQGGGAGAARLLARLPRPWRALQPFLEERLLAGLAPADAALIMELGALGRFSTAFAGQVRDDPGVGAGLRRLTDLGLPIDRDPDDEGVCVAHPLFAAFLAERMTADAPERLRSLHRAAAHWYADRGLLSEAVRSAFASNDPAFAAELLARASAERRRVGRFRAFAGWTSRLPEELFERYPTLRIEAACAHAALFEHEAARLYAEPARLAYDDLSPLARDDLHAVDAIIAIYADRPDAALDAGLKGLRACTGFDPYTMGTLRLATAYGYMSKGAPEAARQALVKARADHEQANSHFGMACALALSGLSHAIQGRLGAAAADWGDADRAICAMPEAEVVGSVAIGYLPETLYERNDIEGAEAILRRCLADSMEVALPDMVASLFVAAARLAAGQGEAARVIEVLDAAEVAALRRGWPRLAHVVAWERVRNAVLSGQLDEARRLAAVATAEPGFREPDGHLPHAVAMEADQIGPLRLEIALGATRGTLSRLRAAVNHANVQRRVWRQVRLLILEARAHAQLGARATALRTLRRAVELSAPGRMVRSYVDEGPEVLDLAGRVAGRGTPGAAGSADRLSGIDPGGRRPGRRRGGRPADPCRAAFEARGRRAGDAGGGTVQRRDRRAAVRLAAHREMAPAAHL